MHTRQTRRRWLVGRRTIRSFVGMVVAFFLALSLWGHISGTRALFTGLEQRLRLLQEQLDMLNGTRELFTSLEQRVRLSQDQLVNLQEQLVSLQEQLVSLQEQLDVLQGSLRLAAPPADARPSPQ